jgi:ParB-like chromosome segregation protein Spo0J
MTALSIDRTMRVDAIDAAGRYREDMGDVRMLAESIERVGLLHPVVVTPGGKLIAGGRRLAAVAELGRDEIPVTVVDSLTDARSILEAERDENTCRMDMKPSERVALGLALEELERPKARERQLAGRPSENISEGRGQDTQTLAIVGNAVGMSRPTYARAKQVVLAARDGEPGAEEALAQMDATGKVRGAWEAVIAGREPTPATTGRKPQRIDPATGRGRQQAEAQHRRTIDLIGQVNGLAAGAAHIKTDAVLAVADKAELAALTRQLGQSITALKNFKRELERSPA